MTHVYKPPRYRGDGDRGEDRGRGSRPIASSGRAAASADRSETPTGNLLA
jgi:hypothetical protein